MLGAQRARFEGLKNAAARPFVSLGVPPMAITLSAIPLCLLAGACWWAGRPGLSLTLAITASLTDFVDGAVARATGHLTKTGDYLEAVIDRFVELLLLCQLSLGCGPAATFALGFCMLTSYCKPRLAQVIPIDNSDWPGLGDHADRMVLIEVAWALAVFGCPRSAVAVLFLLAGLGAFGTLQRIRHAQGLIREAGLR